MGALIAVNHFTVIPAKAGIQARNAWELSSRGTTSPSFQRTLEPILIWVRARVLHRKRWR
jgi:hypothetical protein